MSSYKQKLIIFLIFLFIYSIKIYAQNKQYNLSLNLPIGYASLDVVACNLLSHHKNQAVFKSTSDYTGFLDASGNSHWHGWQKSPLVFGHFTSGEFEKGFKEHRSHVC